MLETGTKAPDFELPDQNGKIHKLSDYAGKKVILYFYPKDNTPGCTKQACGFSERYPQFMQKGAVILGVSKDSVSSHKKFEEKFGFFFGLEAGLASLRPQRRNNIRRTQLKVGTADCAGKTHFNQFEPCRTLIVLEHFCELIVTDVCILALHF